jgi:hypothetical protein
MEGEAKGDDEEILFIHWTQAVDTCDSAFPDPFAHSVWNLAKEDLCHTRSFQVLLLFILVEGWNAIYVNPFANLEELTQSMSFIHQNALHFSLYEKNQLICKQLTSRCWLTGFATEFPTCWSYNVCNIDFYLEGNGYMHLHV